MYKTGDTVLYGSEGVCKITDITEKQFGDVSIEYYILTPVFNNRSTFFVPTKNETLVSRMRPILTNREILDLINECGECTDWIENDFERKEYFKSVVSEGEIKSVIAMLKSLIHHREVIAPCGKKLHKYDEIAFKECQKIIYEELAMDMDLSKDDVIDLICGKHI